MTDKEFNNILDECLERIVLDGETMEQCLRLYPEQAAELEPLLETVLSVKEASAIQPRPEFKARARYRFRSALGEKAAPKRRSFFGWVPRWATALAIVLVVLMAGGGTVAAASNSMPDSILYPVKLATENVQLALTTSELGKARLCANFADRRVAEIIYMADRGDAHQVELITERLDDRLETLAVLASELEAGESQEFLAASGGADSGTPAPTEPPLVEEGGGWGKSGHSQPQNRAGLRVVVAGSAANNGAVMRAMLDEVPESVEAALLEAIAVLEDGYEKVLQALE
ncbi:MAG: DUF5667 domain-containing protein [Chloroflexi bacterium]|nr:DUF5667 domain-containing protein [Chloroflexota bacterium]